MVPAYNYARYLGEAIDSVLAQTHGEFELIIVDDGSTDDTRQVVEARSGGRVRYVYQKNQGLSAARNTGIREARHEFVAFLDADDVWMPTHLEETVRAFTKLPPTFGLIAALNDRMTHDGQPIGTRKPTRWQNVQEIPVGDIITKTRFMPSTAVVRRQAFADCGDFDTTLRSSEDREMWIRIGAKYQIACLGHATVRVRKHGSNMSKHAERMRMSMERVIERAFERQIVPQSNRLFWMRVWSIHYFQYGWMLHDETRYADAVRAALRSLILYPLPIDGEPMSEPRFFRLRALLRYLLCLSRQNRRA